MVAGKQAAHAVWRPVDVSYTVTQTGDFVATADLGTKTVTVPAGTARSQPQRACRLFTTPPANHTAP